MLANFPCMKFGSPISRLRTYVDRGESKNMATTQCEAVDARRCFPCWDEPALKAIFQITLTVPEEMTALSNMPVIKEDLHGQIKTVYFEETPIMSTYLVAVVVGAFHYIEDTASDGTGVRVYCLTGKSEKGRFALALALKDLDFFGKYFSTPYPLPKLHMVAVPDFSGGATENYGLIIYRESELLLDETHSTAANRQRMAIVVAHEVAHQWFGNLVTMEWWTHLWLNEGFATWISYLAVDGFFPEWKIWTQFLKEINCGLRLDALEESHPIERSLCSYMSRYAGKNTKTEDLWKILSEEASYQVNKMMDTWTKQIGYPLVSVNLQGHSLEFRQSQFLSSGMHGSRERIIPITICAGSYTRSKKFLLETRCGTLDMSDMLCSVEKPTKEKCGEDIWIKVNIEQTGFYRVKYDDSLASQLKKALQNNCLTVADKYGILDDTYALCEDCEVPFSTLVSFMDVYQGEIEHILLSRLIDICYSVAMISGYAIPKMVDSLKQFFINLLTSSAELLISL